MSKFSPIPVPKGRNQGLNLFIGQGFVQTRLFDVENLAAQRQDGLEAAIATLLSRTTCAVTLYNVEFALSRVAAGAVGQFTGQRHAFQRTLTEDEVARFLGRFAGAEGSARLV